MTQIPTIPLGSAWNMWGRVKYWPFPVQVPHGEKYFFSILDDKSNWGFTSGLKLKSDAFSSYLTTEAFLEQSASAVVLTVRCGGELELTAGCMGAHLLSKGITLQRTVPYAHQQNCKSERYIRTLEEGGQALLADAGLPMSFWLDAILTRQYLLNRLPTSTLPDDTTPFEVITNSQKPDFSHLCVWGCDCYVAVPNEVCGKAGPKGFCTIFVGYEEHQIGWRVRSLEGHYSFSNDVVFNKNVAGHLGVPCQLSSISSDSTAPPPSRVSHDRPHIRTSAGCDFDEVIHLKALQKDERDKRLAVPFASVNGGAIIPVPLAASSVDLSPSEPILAYLSSLVMPPFSPGTSDVSSLHWMEHDIFWQHIMDSPLALRVAAAYFRPKSQSFNLSKEPLSYSKALARSDAPVWQAAMDRERTSLWDMGAFEEVSLPPGEHTIGLKWVYTFKTDAEGRNIPGKEKAHLVAQGFNQRPGQFDETYAPITKLASVCTLLAWAAVHDLKNFQFDCKTVFLHTKIRHSLFACPFPGCPASDASKVLCILVVLYSLRQSAYEFYMLIMSLILSLGMVRCEFDHGIFMGEWTSPPDPSVVMPSDGSSLILYVLLHVDDGLAITNSHSLYAWFLSSLSTHLQIVDLGYLAISTRLDISFYAMWLGQFNAAPMRNHLLIVKHVLCYLAHTWTLALCLGSPSSCVPLTLSGYMKNVGCLDADWASDTVDQKSISGYSFFFQGSLISWSAVKQKAIALSSTEVEYYAMAHAFKEALWICSFLSLLKLPVPRPFPILSDNQAACSLLNSLAISARSKHIDICHHFLHDHVQAGSFSTTWLPTLDMPADIFTKALPFVTFSRHQDVLGLSVPPSLS